MAKKDISYNDAVAEIEEILHQIENEELAPELFQIPPGYISFQR